MGENLNGYLVEKRERGNQSRRIHEKAVMRTLGLPYDEIVAAQKYCDVDSLLDRVQKRIENEEDCMRKALRIIASVHGVHRLRRKYCGRLFRLLKKTNEKILGE
ncbi:hypothetical protein CEXT_435671 [Caerostris extrusa]|uniref:Uncharacterized protein n=1 Tax=Caerostris extrusa TaxID=172846 RepID=A0AAV4TGW6_CAEEX|nr:hypothetical protein CEXT_435671 [Caerostris extrusa]